ncbi:unnamed protein product [Agarophyton chilense]|eukprot:gb/GEZJ01000049.1/.p1 GENE.gb/GEZJ01000049.1/~~gb/GEZJ01000049.1/.p1  ORF type:complete len:1752 (+),score=233.27 gb/GEZJ01000049.1/:2249-7504(+)
MTNGSPTSDVQRVVETSPDGRYIRYSSILGKGAYKTVYEAFDTEEALQVAWNKLHVDRLSEHDLEKVSNEVSLLRKVTHKNIIKFYDSWRGADSNGNQAINFITEQMMSGTLKEYLRKAQAIKLKVIRRWCSNILDAVAYLHTQTPPIMHRDLKCDNIFINGHVGEVKIGDLGLSGVKEREKADSVIGTPEFMAPELYEESYTEKVDIYAFGMCLLEIVSMEYPYSECTNMAQIFKKVFGGEKPRAFEMLVDGDVKEVIAACLQREPLRPSAFELLKHPLFSDWETDAGRISNLSLVKSLSQSTQAKQVAQTVMPIGTDLIDWSDPLQRHMLVRMQEGENGAGDENQVSVRASNQNGGFVIGLEIPIRDAIKRVEFTFDPFEDSAKHIAQEMVAEFGLGDEQLMVIQEEVERQVKMANDQRYQREVLSRNATPQATPRSSEGPHISTSIQPTNVAGTILEDTGMSRQQPRAQQPTPSVALTRNSQPQQITQPVEQQSQHHSSSQMSVPGTSEHNIVEVVASTHEGRSVDRLSKAGDDHIATEQHFDVSSAPLHRQEKRIVTSSQQDIFPTNETAIAEEVESQKLFVPPEKPKSLSLPPSVPEYSGDQSNDTAQFRKSSELSNEGDLAPAAQVDQKSIQMLLDPHPGHGQQANHQQVEQRNVVTFQTALLRPIQEHRVRRQDLPVSVQHSVASQDLPPSHNVTYEGTRQTSFSSRSDLGVHDGEEIIGEVPPISATQIAEVTVSHPEVPLSNQQDKSFIQAQFVPVKGTPDSSIDAPGAGSLREIVAQDVIAIQTDDRISQPLPQASLLASSGPLSSNSIVATMASTPRLSPAIEDGDELMNPLIGKQSIPIEDRSGHTCKSSPHKSNLESHVSRSIVKKQVGYGSQRGNQDDVRPVEIRRIATESNPIPTLFIPEVERPYRAPQRTSSRSNGFPRTLSERPVSTPPVEQALHPTSIPQSISDGNLPRPPLDFACIPDDPREHVFSTQSPSIERLHKENRTPSRSSPYEVPSTVPGTETEAMSQAVLSRPGAETYAFSVHSFPEGEAETQNRRPVSQNEPRSGSRPQIVVVNNESAKPRREVNGSSNVQETSTQNPVLSTAPGSSDQGDSLVDSYSSPERRIPASLKGGRVLPNGDTLVGSQLSLSEDSPPWVSSPSLHRVSNGSAQGSHWQKPEMDLQDLGAGQQNYTECLKLIDLCSRGMYDEVLEKIDSGLASVKFADYDKRTPLHIAAAEGQANICALLIERGADVNAKDRWGHTPLWDAKMNGHKGVQELLLSHKGADTSFSMDVTSFELMQYAAKGDLEAVRDRIVAGAKATFQDYDRRTPLHLACSEGHVEVAELLLVNGASHSVRDRVGRSPVDDAVTNGHRKILCVLRQYGATIPPHLLEAQPESINQKGMDLVEHAARGRVDAVKQYLKQGANPNFGDYDHRTPLHLACVEGRHEVVQILLQAGANIHLRDRWGSTPLDEARKGGYSDVVEEIKQWDRKTKQQSDTDSPEHSTAVTGLDGPVVSSTQEDFSSFDHMSHGIPTSVSMGTIPSMHITPDDFAAKYNRAEGPNGRDVEHAPPLSAPQPHLVPVEMFEAGLNAGSVEDVRVVRHPRHSDGDLGESHNSSDRSVRSRFTADSERPLMGSGDLRPGGIRSGVPPVQGADTIQRVVAPITSHQTGDFRLAYVSVPNGSTTEHNSDRFPTMQHNRVRLSPVSISSRRLTNADIYDVHQTGEGPSLGPNVQANSAVRLLVDGLIDAAVSER